MNQNDYLKKYLSVNKDKKKSKKRKQHDDRGNFKIIDDTLECEDTEPNFEYDEDAPTVAAITYESDPSVKSSLPVDQGSDNYRRAINESKMIVDDSSKGMTVMKRRKLMKSKKLTPEEEARNEREAVLQNVVNDQHSHWSQGVKQAERLRQKMQDDSVEAAKEFARHANDEDLNARLKNVAREDDPMLAYINRKNSEKLTAVMPTYKGSYPPNRYNITPGYRWDGVNRSNGYEKSYFEKKNAKLAHEEDMYKWSVEDM